MATRPLPQPFIFICQDCSAEGHSHTSAPPEGWDVIEPATIMGQPGLIRCPDCAEMIEQQHFARHAATAPIHAASDAPARARPGCLLALAEGGYRIVIADTGVNRTPVGMILSPIEAVALAHDLVRHVELALNPGSMVTGAVGS